MGSFIFSHVTNFCDTLRLFEFTQEDDNFVVETSVEYDKYYLDRRD